MSNDILYGDSSANTLYGYDDNDTLFGYGSGDTLDGGADNDTIDGGDGADIILGGAGNDTIIGAAGADTIDGGSDIDTAWYLSSSAAVQVSLLAGTGSGGDAAGDTLSNVENLVGSNYADTLTGSAGANVLDGAGGSDTLTGGAGNDILIGDRINLLRWSEDLSSVWSATVATVTTNAIAGPNGDITADKLVEATGTWEHFVSQTVSYGAGETSTFSTYAKAGERSEVILYYTGGTATGFARFDLSGGTAGITGAFGGGTVSSTAIDSVGNGWYRIQMTFVPDAAQTSSAVRIELRNGADNYTGDGSSGAYFWGAQFEIGTTANPYTFTGDTAAIAGNDVLVGGDDNDTLNGGSGDDSLDGGNGTDTANYSSAVAGVVANLSAGTASGGAGSDTLTAIENISGSSFADTLTGDSGVNTLVGGAGNDVINGGGDADTLDGGDGSDTLAGGAGADRLEGGGGGFDFASYASSGAAVQVNLQGGTATGGDAQGDVLTGIENLIGSAYGDYLVGGGGSHRLEGGDSSDTLDGGANNDNLLGGNGNDTLIGGTGDDTIDGGGDTDTADYFSATSGMTVSLAAGTTSGGDGSDLLSNIENVTGSGYVDTLIGDSGNNFLLGGAGDDTLDGGNGTDTLVGGAGADQIEGGGGGNDTASYADSNAAVQINLQANTATGGHAQGDVLSGIENLIGSSYGDSLFGGTGSHRLEGGGGSDTLDGGAGDDVLFGDAGNDFLLGGLGASGDVNLIYGGSGSDELHCGSGVSTIYGGDDGDQIYGGYGSDTLSGDAGNDLIIAGEEDDTVFGGNGADTMFGALGDDTLIGGADNDLFIYLNGDGNDVITDFQGGSGAGDQVSIDVSGVNTFSDVQALMSQVGADTVITFAGGSTITLLSVTATNLASDDFVL